MSDQFHHDDLTGLQNRRLGGHLYNLLRDIVTQTHPIVACTALGTLFFNACNAADVDYDATLDQIAEALERGELGLNDDVQFVPQIGHGD